MKKGSFDLVSRSGMLRAICGLLYLSVLSLAVYSIDLFYKARERGVSHMDLTPVVAMFLCMAGCQLIHIALNHKHERYSTWIYGMEVFVFLLCAALVEFSKQNSLAPWTKAEESPSDLVFYHVTMIYAIAQIVGRILCIARDGTNQSLALNGIAILFLALFAWHRQLLELLFLIAVQTMFHVTTISFATVDMSTLRKIIKKTYAVEILFGIILMIVSVSVILPHFEKQIKSFSDALWYCFAIVTTIGFGDMSATTPIGRFLSVVLGIHGIIVVSLITSIIVNFYSETKDGGETTAGGEAAPREDVAQVRHFLLRRRKK